MATIRNIYHHILLALLVWGYSDGIPAVGQTALERQIGPELSTFQKVDSSTLRQHLTTIYLQEVGTREVGKNNHGPGPKKYLAACGLGEGYAYCACFVKWSLLQIGIPTPGTAWSPSWASGKSVFWKQGSVIAREERPRQSNLPPPARHPQPGDVFTLYYTNIRRVGHVGFIHIWNDPRADDWAFTVEGNTNGEGSREGDGVHMRRRLKRSIYTIANFIDP